ncbi:hypothetical protein QE152_g12611 [Popillia japonica]|uniref:Uncharacterized protein n=1 Tax=Popillia japonica TaxID=7064 RepID=A0AAW1LI40_POPJA
MECNMDIKCGYCPFLIARDFETACRHFPMHSCLATFEHLSIDADGKAFGYQTNTQTQHLDNGDDIEEGEGIIEQNTEKWSDEEILLLINTYDEQKEKFMSPMYNKKQV